MKTTLIVRMPASVKLPGLRQILFGIFVLALFPVALAQPAETVTRVEFDAWMQEISNWGRWGDEDELGTLNLITDQKRIEANRSGSASA